MHFINRIRITLAIVLSTIAVPVLAQNVTVQGQLSTHHARWHFEEEGEPISYVGDYSVWPVMEPEPKCDFSNSNKLFDACLFEWVVTPAGFAEESDYRLRGAPQGIGNHDFMYKLYFISGSEQNQVEVQGGSHSIEAVDAGPPAFVDIEAHWTYRKKPGFQQDTNSRYEALTGFMVEIEPRSYRQAIYIPNSLRSRCELEIGETKCLMPLSPVDRIDTSLSHTGTDSLSLAYGDVNEHFSNPLTVNYSWDYRPPVIEQLAVRSATTLNEDEQSITVETTTYDLNNDEAYVVVSSPHYAIQDDWWIPANMELVAVPSGSTNVIHSGYSLKPTVIPHSGSVIRIGPEMLVYVFDISGLPDGVYDFTTTATDRMGNESDPLTIEDKLIDRRSPELIALYEGEVFQGGDVYFIQDLSFKAIDGLHETDFIVQSIRFNDIEMMFTGPDNEAQAIVQPIGEELNFNTSYVVHVEGVDDQGESMSMSLPINYMPVDFALENTRKGDVDRTIQLVNLKLKQVFGETCKLYADKDTAVSYTGFLKRTCYVQWGDRPITIEPDPIRPYRYIGGFFETLGENLVEYQIWMVDGNGLEALADAGAYAVNVVEPLVPHIYTSNGVEIAPNKFALPTTPGGQLAKVRVKAGKGDLTMTLTGDEIEPTEVFYDHTKSTAGYSFLTQSISLSDEAELWSETSYQVNALYDRLPDLTSSLEITGVRVPRHDIRLDISQTADALLTDETVPVKAKLGAYSRFKGFSDYTSDMGEWTVYLAYKDTNGNIVPLTSTQTMVNGEADFTLDASVLQGNLYFAQADLVSPIPEYQRSLESNLNQIHYIKTGALQGSLNTYEISGRIPFSVYLSWRGDSKMDSEALGNIVWFYSEDNSTWTEVSGQNVSGNKAIFSFDEVGDYYVRAVVSNKNDSSLAQTETAHIEAYYRPRLHFESYSNIFVGGSTNIQLFIDRDYPDESVDVQWSLDGGNTWASGLGIISVDGEYPNQKISVAARVRKVNDPSGNWTEGRTTVYVRDYGPPRVVLSTPSMVEKDQSYPVKANVYPPYPDMDMTTSGYFLLADGSQVLGNEMDFSATQAELDAEKVVFTYHAWIDGLQVETESITTKTVDAWEYQWPRWYMKLVASPKVVPADITATVRASRYAPALDPDYIWNAPLLTLDSQPEPGVGVFRATSPGVYPIQVTVSDDKGNLTRIEQFIEVFEADPYQLTLPVRYNNPAHREPVDISVRAVISGGHPDDTITHYRWYLDGELQDAESYYFRQEDLTEGVYNLELEIQTAFGLIERVSSEVVVSDNQLPECDLVKDYVNTGVLVKAICQDPDGSMAYYDWLIKGVESAIHSSRILVTNESDEPIPVSVTAYDNSGEAVSYSIVVQP